jgi:ADP-ribose pyrophosphatase YjhB (NUDIX family)
MVWKPSVTVAAIVEQEGRFLMVEEETETGIVFNQPAGHLEPNETLIAGVARETLEETAYSVRPESLLGIYRWHAASSDTTYLRFAFKARVLGHDPGRALDHGILRALWLTPEEIRSFRLRHRSPLVMRCVEDCLAGRSYPLELIHHIG